MKRLGPLTHYVTFWSGLVIVTAMMALALWSPSARRVGAAALAATVVGMASTPVAAAENTDTAIRPFKVKVPDADLADLSLPSSPFLFFAAVVVVAVVTTLGRTHNAHEHGVL